MITQIGGTGPKTQDLVTSFQLIEGDSLTAFHMWYPKAWGEIYLLNDKSGQKKNLTGE